ncbi:MAG: hypothetical protein R3308_01630 [Thiohalobacterales bacterium]|nr:hypothetical protein [Thiohalobacterales bacterium]
MAVIYDMVTGEVISDGAVSRSTPAPNDIPACSPALQTIDAHRAIEDMPPVDAYMVLLQRILKKL